MKHRVCIHNFARAGKITHLSRSSWLLSESLRRAPVFAHLQSQITLQTTVVSMVPVARGLVSAAAKTIAAPTSADAVSSARFSPGLYGVPGLHKPEDLISITTRIVEHCQELQLRLDLLEGVYGTAG